MQPTQLLLFLLLLLLLFGGSDLISIVFHQRWFMYEYVPRNEGKVKEWWIYPSSKPLVFNIVSLVSFHHLTLPFIVMDREGQSCKNYHWDLRTYRPR